MKKDIDNIFAYIRSNEGQPIRTPEQMLRPLITNPPDTEWQENINKQPWGSGYIGEKNFPPDEIKLMEKIRAFGGHEICMHGREEDAERLLARGQLWYGDKVSLMKGDKSQCHRNACRLWEANKEKNGKDNETPTVAIATGYALSKDGMWRQHSWVILKNSRSVSVVETTEKRVAYFGFVMTNTEALSFCEDCLW